MMYACPFNYVGGKSKLLPTLLPFFADSTEKVFVDLFGGGFSVGLNVANREVVYNDINPDLVKLISVIQDTSFENLEERLLSLIAYYGLSKTNREGYSRLRIDFNASRDSFLFCLLIFYAFNHQIRYNSRLQFNTPFGANRSSYNLRTQKNLRNFSRIIHAKKVHLSSRDFRAVRIPSNSVVYIDPPYLITTGSYNDGNRGVSVWDEEKEKDLYAYIDDLDHKGIPFVLSNMLVKSDRINMLLDVWKRKYATVNVSTHYKNYQRGDHISNEIIVTNMKLKG